jgi:hypothetical protein
MADVGGLKATGKNEYKNPALSIGDVEQGVRPLLAKHGVIVRFRLDHEHGGLQKLEQRTWQANVIATVENAETTEHFEEPWADTGATPAAAYSFVRKSYLKGLLHLAEGEDDEGGSPPPQQERKRERRQPEPNGHAEAATYTDADLADLIQLADELPKKKKDEAWVRQQLQQFSFHSVRDAIVAQHRIQCGEGCEHVQPTQTAMGMGS